MEQLWLIDLWLSPDYPDFVFLYVYFSAVSVNLINTAACARAARRLCTNALMQWHHAALARADPR